MMPVRSSRWLLGFCWVSLFTWACAEAELAPKPCAGDASSCQVVEAGGAPGGAGGSQDSGGTPTATGGTIASTGGVATTTGGTVLGTGGTPPTSGGTASGGTVATGGAVALGGTTATGGTLAAGTGGAAGKSSTGGVSATGGKAGTGGTTGGGGSGTGGQVATGGVSTGGVATGGASTGGVSTGGVAGGATGGTGGTGPVVELAMGKPATAKAAQAANPVANGNDGVTTTRFCAADGTTGHWWRVDLGAVHSLTRVEIMWEFARQYGYLIEVSSDDVTYTTAADRSTTTDTTQNQTVPISAAARYVRITVTTLTASPKTWMSFFEFKVYGT